MALPRVELLSSSETPKIQFAKNMFKELERQRLSANLDVLRKIYKFDGSTITVFSSNWNNFVRLEGGGFLPLILLTDKSVGFGFDYLSSTSQEAKITGSTEPLIPAFNGRSQFGDNTYSTYQKGWTTGEIGNVGFSFSGSINLLEMMFFATSSGLYARRGESFGKVADLDIGTIIPWLKGAYGPWGAAVGYRSVAWNLYSGAILAAFNPGTRDIYEQWHWIPSFYTIAPGNTFGIRNGWYYGEGPLNTPYGNFPDDILPFPLTYAEVDLLAVMDCRNFIAVSNGEYQFGWAEIVKKVIAREEESLPNDVYFYLSDTILSPNFDNFYNSQVTLQQNNAKSYRIQSDLGGNEYSFVIHPKTANDPKLDLWCFESFISQKTNAVGVVYSDGKEASLYRYKLYLDTVYETENYHSHSRSNDGSKVAIFEGSGFIIERVLVFDLYGVKSEGSSEYGSDGASLISTSSDFAGLGMTEGVLINYRKPDFQEYDLSWEPGLVPATPWTIPDVTEELSPVGEIHFIDTGKIAPYIAKVIVEDGVNARFVTSVDDCFASTFVIDDPDLGIETKHLVGHWDIRGGVRGTLRGSFVGDKNTMVFNGEGRGDIGTYTLNPYITLGETTDPLTGSIISVVGSVLGDIEWGAGFDENGIADFDLAEAVCDPDPGYKFTVSSTCGEYGELIISPGIGLTLSGPDYVDPDVDVGGEDDIFSANGGIAPYSWSFDKGIIVSNGDNTATVTFVDDCAPGETTRTGTITVTDACGESVEVTVRLSGGGWAQNPGGNYWTALAPCPTSNVLADPIRIISGDTRYDIFISAIVNPYSECPPTTCTYMGYSCAENVTKAQYSDEWASGGTGTQRYDVMSPARAIRYKWVCQ